jgi:hypothetical protein
VPHEVQGGCVRSEESGGRMVWPESSIARLGLPGSGGTLGSVLRFALTMAAGGA